MRTKHLFFALALPVAFAACSQEEFVNNEAIANDNLVELGEGFALVGQGVSNAATKGLWEQDAQTRDLGWSWLPAINGTEALGTGTTLSVTADRIGLCWTGELADGTGAIGANVFTNYEFLHNGWLAKGQEEATFNECDITELTNGKLYKDVVVAGSEATATELKAKLAGDDNKVNLGGGKEANLDLNTAVFATENKAIFGGSYIVYYPYNNAFAEAGSVPATSPAAYADVKVDNLGAEHVAKNTYLVGYAQNLIGGSQASKFSLNPLSSIISLQLRQSKGAAKTITKVALWSENGFVTSVGLDASKIKSLGYKGGEALYTADKKTSSTIVAAIENTGVELNVGTTAASAYKKIYLPILPTTLKNLKVILYAGNEIAIKELTGSYAFAPASGKSVKVDVAADEFKSNVRVAVDAATFKTYAEQDATKQQPATVQVIGDITLTQNVTIDSYVTVQGGKIIVPEDKTLTIAENGTIKSAVEVQGLSCCGSAANAGKMVVSNAKATVAGEVALMTGLKKAGNKSAELEFTAGTVAKDAVITAKKAAKVTFKGATNIFGTVTLEKDSEALVDTNADVNAYGATITNNGTFTVYGKFAMLAADGKTEATAGEKYTNNGTFIDKVGANVGGATQYMVNNGDYICEVADQEKLQEAYIQKTAANIIDLVSETTYNLDCVEQHNGKDVDIWVSAGGVDNANKVVIKSTKAVTIGNLTIKAGKRLHINPTLALTDDKNNVIGYATLTVNGDINAYGNFNTETDVIKMAAKNLNIFKGAYAYFDNRSNSNLETLMVESTITVVEGTCHIADPKGNTNHALVTCRVLDGAKGTFVGGQPKVIR